MDEGGVVNHAEVRLGDDSVMLGSPGADYRNPKNAGYSSALVHVYVDDVDSHFERAKAAGASDTRIILRHILPNCVGPIVVTMTLLVATAILIEAALSFLGFGIQPPQPALGKLIAEGETEGFSLWWLVTFPGLMIVIICLAVNFVGDGLRDALDPTQRRIRA